MLDLSQVVPTTPPPGVIYVVYDILLNNYLFGIIQEISIDKVLDATMERK